MIVPIIKYGSHSWAKKKNYVYNELRCNLLEVEEDALQLIK